MGLAVLMGIAGGVLPAFRAARKYEAGPYKGFADDVLKGFSSIVPADANVEGVAESDDTDRLKIDPGILQFTRAVAFAVKGNDLCSTHD